MLKKALPALIESGLFLTAALMPLYLIKFKIWWVPFTLLELIIYATFALWLIDRGKGINRLRDVLKSPKIKLWALPILLLAIAALMAALLSADIQISAGIIKGWFIAPLLLSVVLVDVVKSRVQIKNIISAALLSALMVSLISFIYYINGFLTFDGRLSAFYLSPNHLGIYLATIFILSLYLYFLLDKKRHHIALLCIQAWMLYIIYLTLSYGTWLALALALLVLFFINIKKQLLSRKLIVAALLLFVLASFWQLPSDKFQDFLHSSRSSFYSRMTVWQSAQLMIRDYPLQGIGPGMFQKYYLDYQKYFEPYLEWAMTQPHNIFLAFWLQTGILGLIAFGWLLVVFFRQLAKSFSSLAIILMIAMIYTILHGLIDTPYWKNDLAVIFWIIIALAIVETRKAIRE